MKIHTISLWLEDKNMKHIFLVHRKLVKAVAEDWIQMN